MFLASRDVRPSVSRLLGALVLAVSFAGAAHAQTSPLPQAWRDAARALEPFSRTGVLYERVLPLAHIERLDGAAGAPVIDRATWRQAYDELRRAANVPEGPELSAIDSDARASIRAGVIPLAILDRRFERLRPGAVADGSVRVTANGLEVAGGSPLVESRAVAAAALAPRTYRGGDVVFALERRWFLTDDAADPREVAVDFADGLGPRTVGFGERVHVHYAEPGRRTLRAAITRSDGSRAETRFVFDVAATTIPDPTDTLHVTATIPWHGQYGTGDAYVYLAPGHTALANPVVMVEGFDIDNSMNWDELYTLLDQQGLIETLRADGYDAVVLNFTDATDAIEKNAFVVAQLVEQVQASIGPATTVALVGASMGGLCSRYALAYMETHAIAHRVRTWISFDGPQAGADIPLGLQHWINFFSGQSTSAADFLASLQRPAAREMLLDHFSAISGTGAHAAPERDSLAASLAAVGQYPKLPRRVAIANGSGSAASQGFAPGAQVIRYEYNNGLVAITGDVWALGNQASTQVFNGKIRILFGTTSQSVTVAGTPPWDGAPGGSRASFTELDTTAAPYGDIVALYPSHCFIPVISSLALSTSDPFFDLATATNPQAMSPFDAIYYPVENQEHVAITPDNAVWVRNEIERGVVLAVPAGGPGGARGRPALASLPNPFFGSARLAWSIPRAGEADVRVFAADGREVRTLAHGPAAAGTHELAWDGRDAGGARAPAGIYFLRLETPDGAVTRKIVRLR